MTETEEQRVRRARGARRAWIAAGLVLLGLGGYTLLVTLRWSPGHWALAGFLVVFGGFMLWNGVTRRLFPQRLR